MRYELNSLPGLDLASGTFTVPLWVVGIAAAVIVALVVIAVVRSGLNEFGSLVFRAAVIVIAVVLGWAISAALASGTRRTSVGRLTIARLNSLAVRPYRGRRLHASRPRTLRPLRALASAPCSQARKQSRRRRPISRRASHCWPMRTNTPRGVIKVTVVDCRAAAHHCSRPLRACLAGAGDAGWLHGGCLRCVRARL